jgi:hypothetical protein
MKLENLPNDVLRKIAKHTGKNIARLDIALVGSTRSRSVIKNQILSERSKHYARNKKLILNFKRKRSTSNKHYGGRGHFNISMPGVYKNKKWKYFYETTYYDPKQEMYVNIPLFYNTRNGNPVFIHPITGARKQVKNERRYLGNISVNNFNYGLTKRSRYNYWPKFAKKASRFIKN